MPGLFRKNEYRNPVLAQLVDQMRPGGLFEVSDPSSQQGEFRSFEFRQVEGERKFPFKPGLDRMAVGRKNVHGRCAGERSNVQVSQFAVDTLPERFLPL